MKTEVIISLIGFIFLSFILVFIMGTSIPSLTGNIIFTEDEIKIHYNDKTSPDTIKLKKDMETKVLIDDIIIKQCFNNLNESITTLDSATNKSLLILPKKIGSIDFLCGENINTKIIIEP